jgi:hypothetical protein
LETTGAFSFNPSIPVSAAGGWQDGAQAISKRFAAASPKDFFNGIVIEPGRKIRLPKDEEEGVADYRLLGRDYEFTSRWTATLVNQDGK